MISIITLHRVKNYGSVLQSLALQNVLAKEGYKVNIIDYYPERLKFFSLLRDLKYKKQLKNNKILIWTARFVIIPSYVIRFSRFNKAVTKYLHLTNRVSIKDSLSKHTPNTNLYITGSDQVWNSEWNQGFDKHFFLVDVPKNKISYASSFGKEELNVSEIKEVKSALSEYKYLSVREISGKKILESLGLKSKVVLDPTLLLDSSDWSNYSSDKYNKKKYILVYNLNDNQQIYDVAQRLSDSYKLQVFYVSYNLHGKVKGMKKILCPTLEDFLSLFRNCEMVVTDSFHATAFSINFNKDFYIVYPNKYSTRVQSMLELTGLQDRVVNSLEELPYTSINFDNVNNIIVNLRHESRNELLREVEKNYENN